MGAVPSANWLSWGSARLLALLLNSLTGLLQFLQREPIQNLATLDSLFALRLLNEHLRTLDDNFRAQTGLNPAIFQAIRNLSRQFEHLGMDSMEEAKRKHPEMIQKFGSILLGMNAVGSKNSRMPQFGEHKLLDERLRWHEKMRNMETGSAPEELWLVPNSGDGILLRCVEPILECCNCTMSRECHQFVGQKGMLGFQLVHQVLLHLFLIDNAQKCQTNKADFDSSEADVFLADRCVNMWDELSSLTAKKQLARMEVRTLGLLMEQAYLCGHLGFVQFANPHLLVALLSWQHPELGCWMANRVEPVPELGIQAAVQFEQLRMNKMPLNGRRKDQKEHSCLVHTSLVAGLSIAGLFLRLLLDPGPWPEQHGLAQILQMDGIPAEEKFHAFRYLEWVHDTDIAVDQGVRMLRPPRSGWSPDLIAFVCLLFVIVLGCVLFVHFCNDENSSEGARRGGPGRKKMYPYSFKKL